MTRDWGAWHRAYDDPASSLSQRRLVVTDMVRDALGRARPGPVTCLSLCAGEGRDLIDAARDHARRHDVRGRLIELDAPIAARAMANVSASGLPLEVVVGDAALTALFVDLVPVDVLLLVGIFGNVSDADVASTIAAVPRLCRAGASVIWTRHRRAPDLTGSIRGWFSAAGCDQVEYATSGVGGFGVGHESVGRHDPSIPVSVRLFSFD